MAKKREYSITRYDRDANIECEIRVPISANITLLLERLICRNLDVETIIASCLRRNHNRFYDPFQILDGREEWRREKARSALKDQPDSSDPIGLFYEAWDAPLPIGKPLLIAGLNHEFFVKEVGS